MCQCMQVVQVLLFKVPTAVLVLTSSFKNSILGSLGDPPK